MANAFAEEIAGVAEVERVIVNGSNIPTAEEVGPNPVDTYRPGDIEKLGVRNSTDLLLKLPQEMGTTVNQNMTSFGDGSVIPNLRGLLPKETLVLIDGKCAAIVGAGGLFSSGSSAAGVDINLIPFPMIDHIDILKDGASAIYGSDAVAGVINIFLPHKFRGLEIGGSYGNTNMGASNDAGEREGWLKAGVEMTRPILWSLSIFTIVPPSTTATVSLAVTRTQFAGVDLISAVQISPAASHVRLIPRLFFSGNSPPPHSAPNVATSPSYVSVSSPHSIMVTVF